ncbi:Sterile alpha motif containing protein [Oryctes borbonicus]|uniref:Sterile alpha motif containing protein n=1 Tax=Oryctes borbonicus TaxID=1629725 RepID=A0A0T6B2U5_9SCAR|nr:Sterile alpha motif containing protein [Oryctes borbonicus]
MASSISTTPTTIVIPDKLQNDQGTNLEDDECTIDSNTIDISITTEVTSSPIHIQPLLTTQTQNTQLLQPIQAKHSVMPFVYIQTPQKLPQTQISMTKTNSNNIFVNTIPQLQLSNLGSNMNSFNGNSSKLAQNITLPTNLTMQNNQSVILTKPQQLVLQKTPVSVQGVPLVPVCTTSTASKNQVAYFTMIKPFPKSQEQNNSNTINRLGLTKLKNDNMQILSNPTSMNSANQKIVLAPMPKVTSNRLPITATTNSVQPKIALMPLPTQSNNFNVNIPSKHKVLNFKIADGQLQTENNGTITVLCDSTGKDDEKQMSSETTGSNLICNEIIDLESPEKNKSENKSYQLSIVEDSNSRNDVSFTVTIPDDVDRSKSVNENVIPKDAPRFSPKHPPVSILKKTVNMLDRKQEKLKSSLIISPVPNSITTISDANTKEVRISTSNSFDLDERVLIQPPPVNLHKPERRRKSQFLCRKDYDEIEVTSTIIDCEIKPKIPRLNQIEVITINEDKEDNLPKPFPNFKMDIELVKEKTDINMNDDYDMTKALHWEDGIGTLPGSDLRFKINEFGILEYLTNDEYKKIMEKIAKVKEKESKKNDLEELRCLICGCFGTASEFITPKYCSYDCVESGEKAAREKEVKIRRKKKKGYFKKNSDNSNDLQKVDKESTPSEEEDSLENSQDKFTYPWSCSKKGFSWSKYLDHVKAKSAPVKLFKDPFPYTRNGFRPGMKLEGIDPQHPSYFCVLSVAEIMGYRIRLHFDGYPENYDFWTNADSMDIFPAGWCEKYGHTLHPPPTYTQEDFNWNHYLKQTKSTAAPKHLFSNRSGTAICPNGFRVGMKLEAVDRKNTALVCVATITDMMDNRILVHFDSWDDIYDYWADPTSPYIHPVGWCDQYGHNLTPPNGHPNPESFTWESYLKDTKTVAAPARAFKQRPANGFKRGMRLECVDKRVPQIIRVATVDDVREHQVRISFDGWPDRYSYWVDDDSTDIHPVGWCHKTGHPLEPPLTPDDVYDFLECPTVGCRGQGHIKGPKFSTHSTQKHCPYADENIDQEHGLPDRLLSPDRQLEAVVPISREPREKTKPRIGRPPKLPRLEPIKQEWPEEDTEKKIVKRKYKKCFKEESPPSYVKKEVMNLANGFTTLEQQQVWEKHSKYLTEYIKGDTDPREWTEDDVMDFVCSLPSCKDHGALFGKHKIDGESFLMLTQQDIVDILNIKLGPAIKLYNSIVLLRQNINCYT